MEQRFPFLRITLVIFDYETLNNNGIMNLKYTNELFNNRY